MRKDQAFRSGFDAHTPGWIAEEIEWDDDTMSATYRAWDEDGRLTEERPATTADTDRFPRIGDPDLP